MDEVWVLMQGDGMPWLERIDDDRDWHEEMARRAVARGARHVELDPNRYFELLKRMGWRVQYVATERGIGVRLLNGCIVEAQP